MCTALLLPTAEGGTLFGRNMDLSYPFGEAPILLPRGYPLPDGITRKKTPLPYAILGMGTLIEGCPAMADAMNEAGLAAAGLNFAGYAHFPQAASAGKRPIAPYDLMLQVLLRCSTVAEARALLQGVQLIAHPLNAETPIPTLHWMFADRSGQSIVAEQTRTGLNIYENPVSVLTNTPEFPWHLTNLAMYPHLTPQQPDEATVPGLGAGTLGLPGGYDSPSRFVRIAYLRQNTPLPAGDEAVGRFFSLLQGAAIPYGAVHTAEGKPHFTRYTCCMDLQHGIYYCRTEQNSRITALRLTAEAGDAPHRFPHRQSPDIFCGN